ncbi:hypothetical protein ACSNOI_18325 [Actinomadura kijaniata]|uniref:hypothetical protein n=1 Tax=Actinomadura kijaniata TaxID=46161 RepID=UPI003F1C02EA
MPEDLEPLCVRCGVEITTIEIGEPGRIESLLHRHLLRVEPWDHPLEMGLGVPTPPPPACDLCGAPDPAWTYPRGPAPRGERGGDAPTAATTGLGGNEFEIALSFERHPDLPADEAPALLLDLLFHDWRACDPCSVMIADRNLEGLVDRALARRPASDGQAITRLRGTFGTFLRFKTRHPEPAHD